MQISLVARSAGVTGLTFCLIEHATSASPTSSGTITRCLIAASGASGTSQLEVLVRRHVEARNRRGHDVVHAGPDADREAEVIDRRLRHLLVQDLLDLVQHRLALLSVQLARLTSEEVVDLGQGPVREGAVLRDE